MAILKNGINGGFSGKVGNVVGTSWRGLEIIRSRPKPPTHFSEKQLANQQKMKLTQFFLKKMIPIVRIGFKNDDIIPTAFNTAMSYNKKNAIVGTYPDLSLDYSLVRLAQGELHFPKDFKLDKDDEGLYFSWSKELGINGFNDDQLMVICYNEESDVVDFCLQAYRHNKEFIFKIAELNNQTIHVWAAFIRQDRTMQSNSFYVSI